jgi:predicted nucleic acid-binding protein
LVDKKDRNHRCVQAFLKGVPKQGRTLVTSTDVLDETVTLLRYRLGHGVAVQFGEKLAASKWCRVVEVTESTRRGAWDTFVGYADQSFSLADCSSFAIMRSMHVGEAFTFDRTDFAAAGFVVRPD